MKKYFTLIFLALSLVSCAGGKIAKENYSKLETPEATFEFAKQAVAKDDPEAFYYCLADYVKKAASLDDVKFGWALAGQYFHIFLEAKLKNVQIPAPDLAYRTDLSTAKVTITSQDLQVDFLLIQDGKEWHMGAPNHYPLPDISKIKKQNALAWRKAPDIYQRTQFYEWLKPKKIKRDTEEKKIVYPILWRHERNYYQTQPADWSQKKKIQRDGKQEEKKSRQPVWRTN